MTELPHFANHFDAMATCFSVVIAQQDVDATYAAQATNAVRLEVERLEEELSRFRPTSEIWRLSNLTPGRRTRIGLATWDCLALAQTLHRETGGAFDVTVGPLMKLWKNADGSPRTPHPDEIAEIRQLTGSHLFELHEEDLAVTVHAAPMVFDLGAIGKGYALDQAVNVLHDWGIHNALLNAGDSTLLGIGAPSGESAWRVRLDEGHDGRQVELVDSAVSGSGIAEQGAHIMDPRTLQPVPVSSERRYATAPTAALADGLSTAFMVLTGSEIAALCERNPGVACLSL